MQKEEIQDLVHKYLNDQATAKELERLSDWYQSAHHENIEWFAEVKNEEALLKAQMLYAIQLQTRPAKPTKLLPKVVAAAAAVATITLGTWLYYSANTHRPVADPGQYQIANDIAPGKHTATLTSADGKTIRLSDAKTGVVIAASSLKYNDGTALEPEHSALRQVVESTKLTATTPRGGTYQVTLADGTKVWLNAASSLHFPSNFKGLANRKVKLTGEAYFEVAKNKAQPFVVEGQGQELEVLGTHFNVNAYPDEGGVKTTLLEGSVKVKNDYTGLILKPHEQSVMKDKQFDVFAVNVEQIVAWKNGQFAFDKQNLQDIMRNIARWYDVEVVYAPDFKSLPFTGSVSRFKNISSVLKVLELTGSVHFKIEGRRVTVMK